MTIKAVTCTTDEWKQMVDDKEADADLTAYHAYCNTIVDAINGGADNVWVIDKHGFFIKASQHFLSLGFTISHHGLVADGLLLVKISKV